MQKYELTLMLDGKTTSTKKKKVQEVLEENLKSGKGKLEKFEEWGTRDLAFKVGKSTTGAYLFFELELDPSTAKALIAKFKSQGEVLKYLLIKVFKKTHDSKSGDELNTYMSSSFKGNPGLESREDVIKKGK